MVLRVFVDQPLVLGRELELPPRAARHVQVRRLQPGEALLLFDGQGGQWHSEVTRMGRQEVRVRPLEFDQTERELGFHVTLALGVPANERVDWLIEKATELGAAAIQPLACERSVLRVAGERAQRKAEHWQAVAEAAAEQCGRNRVPQIAPMRPLAEWLAALSPPTQGQRLLLKPPPGAPHLHGRLALNTHTTVLSGPEGGLTDEEEALALEHGFAAVSLGPRVLRAETAPLAVLAYLGLNT